MRTDEQRVPVSLVAHSGLDHVALGLMAVVAVAGYGWAWMRQPVAWRLLAWAGGVGLVLVASLPFMEQRAEESFTGHMVQHLLVIVLAAPLLVLARPVRTALGARLAAPTRTGRRLAAWWHRWAPIVGPLAFVTILFVTHLSVIYDEALHRRWLHELEHVAYLGGAVLTWAAVLGPRRAGAVGRIGAAFGVSAGGALLGMILLTAPTPLVDTYAARLGEGALDDQRRAAALMWVGGMLATVPLFMLAVWRWASAEHRAVTRAEALVDR